MILWQFSFSLFQSLWIFFSSVSHLDWLPSEVFQSRQISISPKKQIMKKDEKIIWILLSNSIRFILNLHLQHKVFNFSLIFTLILLINQLFTFTFQFIIFYFSFYLFICICLLLSFLFPEVTMSSSLSRWG